jgi:hypothetical protein
MYLQLHCTVRSCYRGCTPVASFTMVFHKFLHAVICKDFETFYGNGEFACGDKGSEPLCCWCGKGGHLYCCSICPNVFCEKCICRNLGRSAVNVIEMNNDLMIGYVISAICDLFGISVPCAGTSAPSSNNKAKMRR